MNPAKYNHIQIALHWVTAALIIFMLTTGSLVLSKIENTVPGKVDNLRVHMILGSIALLLTLVRIVWRKKTPQPASLKTGNGLFDMVGAAMPYLLNLTVLVIVLSGVGLAYFSGTLNVVFLGDGSLPANFYDYLPRYVHEYLGKLMIGLILLHVAGGVYHAIVLKDGIMGRMWFGKK